MLKTHSLHDVLRVAAAHQERVLGHGSAPNPSATETVVEGLTDKKGAVGSSL